MPRFVALTLAALGTAACLGETTLVTPPKPPVTSFTFQFHVDPGDATTAAALGWTDSVPGVALTVTPDDSTRPVQQFQASDAGTVTIDQLEPGDYEVDAVRWLTDPKARLAAGRR
jgi:ABC-type glycerol-3-phosphate transport system substrate-binding protein